MQTRTIIPDVKHTDLNPQQVQDLIEDAVNRTLSGSAVMATLLVKGYYYGGKNNYKELSEELKSINEEARKKAKEAIEKYINS